MTMKNHDLHEAICFGDALRVQDILQRDNSLANEKNRQGNAPLHMVYHGTVAKDVQDGDRLLILDALIKYGADVGARGRWNETPLHIAVRKLQSEAIKLLLKSGADPNARDDDERAPLHSVLVMAASTIKIDIQVEMNVIGLLLRNGADPNAVDASKKTPLIYAAKTDRTDLVRVLVDAGNQNAEMIGLLLSRGADARGRERRLRMTPLHELASSWREHRRDEATGEARSSRSTEASARLLLEHCGDVDARDREDMTALHLAAHTEDEALVRVLLGAGADVDAKDGYGDTPLHQLLDKELCSTGAGQLERIAVLLVREYGANVVARNGKDQTPFSLAVRLDNLNLVNLMLARITGIEEEALCSKIASLAQWRIDTSERLVPDNEISVATILGYERTVSRLIELGRDLEAGDEVLRRGSARAPLYYAVKTRQFRIAKILLEAGCQVDGTYENLDYGTTALHVAVFDARDPQLACLLLEYGADMYREDAFGKNALTYALEHAAVDSSTWSQLARLLVSYCAIDVRFNGLPPSLVSVNENFCKKSSAPTSNLIISCRSELDDLGNNQVFGTELDVLGKRFESVVQFLGDEKNCDAVARIVNIRREADLGSYERIVNIRSELALEKRRLLNSAKEFFNSVLKNVLETIGYQTLPDTIVWNVLGRFNTRELKKIVNENASML